MGTDTTKKNEQNKEDMMQSIIKYHNIKGLKKKDGINRSRYMGYNRRNIS
jgi:hypothetical protein